MEMCWQQVMADWLQLPVQVTSLSTVRDWSESKVLRIVALVDGKRQVFYAKLARSGSDTELAVCRLANQMESFPAPPGIDVEIEGETWLLLQEAPGQQLARNRQPDTFRQAVLALAAFHQRQLPEYLSGLDSLINLVEQARISVWGQVRGAAAAGIFTEVDDRLLSEVECALAGSWPLLQAQLTNMPQTLVHGDCHSGNLFLREQGQLCLIDWGSAMLGPGLFDVVGLVDVARRMREPVGDVDDLLQLYWANLSDISRTRYGNLHTAWQLLSIGRSLLELNWFSHTADDYGQRVNRELLIIQQALKYLSGVSNLG